MSSKCETLYLDNFMFETWTNKDKNPVSRKWTKAEPLALDEWIEVYQMLWKRLKKEHFIGSEPNGVSMQNQLGLISFDCTSFLLFLLSGFMRSTVLFHSVKFVIVHGKIK